MFDNVKSPIRIVSTSATKAQLDKAKEVAKKGPKKLAAMEKAAKELKAGIKAAGKVIKADAKGNDSKADSKIVQTAHKHVKAKPKAGAKVAKSTGPKPDGEKFSFPNKRKKGIYLVVVRAKGTFQDRSGWIDNDDEIKKIKVSKTDTGTVTTTKGKVIQRLAKGKWTKA